MSSFFVRSEITAWLQNQIFLPFFSTINENEEPTAPQWCTVEFSADFSQDITLCGQKMEEGDITIECFGESGKGFTPLMLVVNQLADHMKTYNDPSNRLYLDSGPLVNDHGAASMPRWYGVTVEFTYRFKN